MAIEVFCGTNNKMTQQWQKQNVSKCRNTYLEIKVQDRRKDGKTDNAGTVKT